MNHYHCAACKKTLRGFGKIISCEGMTHGAHICMTCWARMESSPGYRIAVQEALKLEYARVWAENVAIELGISGATLMLALLQGSANATDENEAYAAAERILGLTVGGLDAAIAAAMRKEWCAQ